MTPKNPPLLFKSPSHHSLKLKVFSNLENSQSKSTKSTPPFLPPPWLLIKPQTPPQTYPYAPTYTNIATPMKFAIPFMATHPLAVVVQIEEADATVIKVLKQTALNFLTQQSGPLTWLLIHTSGAHLQPIAPTRPDSLDLVRIIVYRNNTPLGSPPLLGCTQVRTIILHLPSFL